jgi:hypothetical protein
MPVVLDLVLIFSCRYCLFLPGLKPPNVFSFGGPGRPKAEALEYARAYSEIC